MRIIELKETVTASNDRDAAVLRGELKEKGTLLINLMASPGAGKTTLLERTIRDMGDRFSIAVMEADVDSDVDARRLEKLGAKAVQAHTGGMCHMDAGMTRRAFDENIPSCSRSATCSSSPKRTWPPISISTWRPASVGPGD